MTPWPGGMSAVGICPRRDGHANVAHSDGKRIACHEGAFEHGGGHSGRLGIGWLPQPRAAASARPEILDALRGAAQRPGPLRAGSTRHAPRARFAGRNQLVPGHARRGVLAPALAPRTIPSFATELGRLLQSRAGWACSTAVSAGDSSRRCLRAETREVDGMNSGKPSGLAPHGNPEPSRRYTGGRCRDYLRALSALDNRLEHPAPSRTASARVKR